MILRRISFFSFLVAILFSPLSQAVDIKGLYEAEVPVKTQEQRERLSVYPTAISQVIVKISGDTTAPSMPELAATVKNGRRLVQQYHYTPLPDNGDPVLKEEGYTHKLVVQFDGEALTQAMVNAKVPLWGSTRPEVLVWLAIEDREIRYILGASASEELESYLNDASKRRGLPVLLPLMDLDDQLSVRFADIWGGFRQSVMNASERYGVDAVLVGRLYRGDEGPWEARWSLFQDRDTLHWQTRAWSQGQAINNGIDGAADNIAARFAQVFATDANDRLALAVSDVNNLKAYAKALRYLQSLDAVVEVQVAEVRAEEVLFDVAIRTNRHSLARDIALGNVLVESVEEDESMSVGAHLSDRLIYSLIP